MDDLPQGRALASALGHRLRSEILRALGERKSASAREIASKIDAAPSSVSEQLRRLKAQGLIESVGSTHRRGAIERFYRPAEHTKWIDDDEADQLDEPERKRIMLGIARFLVANISAALSAERPVFRRDSCWSSATFRVDGQGWRELAGIYRTALEESLRVRGECAERLARAGGTAGTRISASALLFEVPDD
jgi:DNA-binding transcriptional ArsR family regulator